MFPASGLPSVLPAPTMVCSSSINSTISPFAEVASSITAFKRSSNSPRNLAPASRLEICSVMIFLPLRPSGTSPLTMRWASPSAMAVLPTPGSPISTGLFLVRRSKICMMRRTSSSRPITGSSLPSRAIWVRSRPYFSSDSKVFSAVWVSTFLPPRAASIAVLNTCAAGRP